MRCERRAPEFSALLTGLGVRRCTGIRAQAILATLDWLRAHPGPACALLGIAYGGDRQWGIRAKRGRRILDQPDEQSARIAAQQLADRIGREVHLYARTGYRHIASVKARESQREVLIGPSEFRSSTA